MPVPPPIDLENIAFGLKRGDNDQKRISPVRVEEMLKMDGASQICQRKPHQYLVRHAKRVALARALAKRRSYCVRWKRLARWNREVCVRIPSLN